MKWQLRHQVVDDVGHPVEGNELKPVAALETVRFHKGQAGILVMGTFQIQGLPVQHCL
ncbi:hypothetical protein D3C80_2243620 [compost metagenome]